MTDTKPVPRQRVRAAPPAPPPAPDTAPTPRPRVRARSVEPVSTDTPSPPIRKVYRSSDLSRPWPQLVGTELDPFERGELSPRSNGTACGVGGGGPIMGYMMKADDGRYAIYLRLRSGVLKFKGWCSGTWHDAFAKVGQVWQASREGLKADA